MLLSEEGFQHNRKPGYGQEAARPSIIYLSSAGVAELADAVALGATGRKSLEVQILSPAPNPPLEDLRRAQPKVSALPLFTFPLNSPGEFQCLLRGRPIA